MFPFEILKYLILFCAIVLGLCLQRYDHMYSNHDAQMALHVYMYLFHSYCCKHVYVSLRETMDCMHDYMNHIKLSY